MMYTCLTYEHHMYNSFHGFNALTDDLSHPSIGNMEDWTAPESSRS